MPGGHFQESCSLGRAAEQEKAPGFFWKKQSLLQGYWLLSQCLGLPCATLLLPCWQCLQQRVLGSGPSNNLCISLPLQMARPIQVKPADSESRGGSCHLSLFLLWWPCACEGGQETRQGPDSAFLCMRGVCVWQRSGGRRAVQGHSWTQQAAGSTAAPKGDDVLAPSTPFPSYLRVPSAWQCLPQDITEGDLCGTGAPEAFGKRFLHSST